MIHINDISGTKGSDTFISLDTQPQSPSKIFQGILNAENLFLLSGLISCIYSLRLSVFLSIYLSSKNIAKNPVLIISPRSI